MGNNIRWLYSALRFVTRIAGPPLLLLIGYWWLPEFDSFVAWPPPAGVLRSLLVLLILAGVWLLAEILSAVSRNTGVSELQIDSFVSTFWAVVLTGFAGWYLGGEGIPWWFLVGWAAAVIDAFLTGLLAINNAAQKPFFSKQGVQ
jgi:hypothetical protein